MKTKNGLSELVGGDDMDSLDRGMVVGFALSVMAGVIAWISLVYFMTKRHSE